MKDWEDFPISTEVFANEQLRRYHVSIARRLARRWGKTGRIQFVPYLLVEREAVAIRVHVAKS